MNWAFYIIIYILIILTLFIIVSFVFSGIQEDDFLGRYNSAWMKGIAINCIMLSHFMGKFGNGQTTLFTPLGGIGVSIFLVLSAYGLNESYKTGGGFWWRKRLISVFIPYFIIQSVFYWPFQEWSLLDFVKDIMLIQPKYHNGWYLNYILMWYVIFYSVSKISVFSKHKILIVSSIALISFFFLREIKAEQAMSFFTGIVLSEYKDNVKLRQCLSWKMGIVLIVWGVMFLAIKQIPLVRNMPQIVISFVQLMIKLPCGSGMCVICYLLRNKINYKFFSLVGAISYELYLIHGYVLQNVSVGLQGEIVFVVFSALGALILHFILKVIRKPVYKMLMIK